MPTATGSPSSAPAISSRPDGVVRHVSKSKAKKGRANSESTAVHVPMLPPGSTPTAVPFDVKSILPDCKSPKTFLNYRKLLPRINTTALKLILSNVSMAKAEPLIANPHPIPRPSSMIDPPLGVGTQHLRQTRLVESNLPHLGLRFVYTSVSLSCVDIVIVGVPNRCCLQ
ncbi:hypothetical protein CPB84DRAFT_224868 [Gymnopilus junonius]|uniref:Uncharacterized protein n=1 Tax=Gymnopilus junonius TaxID=109634 RepID=A0A9P5THQ4_GYMJU|nr:hypothetical protein CPB84DRAFT_224868 [Gymnopilus junonius]